MQPPAEKGGETAVALASNGASAQQQAEQSDNGSRAQADTSLKPGGSRKGRGSRARAKVVDIGQPPQFADVPRSSAAGQGSSQAVPASAPANLAPSPPSSAGEQPAGEENGKQAGPSPRRLREFWEQETRQGALPRPRTPQRQPSAALQGDAIAEPAICDRLGTPVLSLRVPSGISRALASVDTLSASLPSLARLRQAAAGLTGAAAPSALAGAAPAAAPVAGASGEAVSRRQAGADAQPAQAQHQQLGEQPAEVKGAAASSRAGPEPAEQPADERAEMPRLSGAAEPDSRAETVFEAGKPDGLLAALQPDSFGEPASLPAVAKPGNQQPAEAAGHSQLAGQTSCVPADDSPEEPAVPAAAAPPVLDSYRPRVSLDLGVASGSSRPSPSVSRASSLRATSDRGSRDGSELADDIDGSVRGPQAAAQTAAAREAALPPMLSALQRSSVPAEPSGRGSDADPEWRAQTKHVFILSNAGKPVFSLHGQEDRLAGFMAVIHAMVAFAIDRGDGLRSLRAGRHTVVFLVRGPLILVTAAATGEPPAWLRTQLGLLHGQLLAILTAGYERTFARNPRFDARRLLGGAEGVLRSLVAGFEASPWALLAAFPPVPLQPQLRHDCLTALQAAVKASGALYGLLLAGDRIVALAQSRAHPFAPSDLLLLVNFVAASPSFRQSPESFSPVCLPAFNPTAFLHAYVAYLHLDARVCLVLLSPDQAAFNRLSATAQGLRRTLRPAIKEVAAGVTAGRDALRLEDLPPAAGGGPAGCSPLLHFAYKSPARGQAVVPQWSGPLEDAVLRKEVMAAYARVHSAMFPERSAAGVLGPPARRIHFEQDARLSVLAVASAEYELYAAFDALVERAQALDTCHRLAAWVKREQATLFVPV